MKKKLRHKTTRYFALIAILPAIAFVITSDTIDQAHALKSEGTNAPGRIGAKSFGSSTDVCGLQLCSEIPGGKDAWKAQQQGEDTKEPEVTPQSIPASSIKSSEKTSETGFSEKDLGSLVRLSRANVPATIPLHMGYYNGESVYFIITDSSDPTHAKVITESQGWKVELAPLLANTPDEVLSTTYMFTNGVKGNGIHGYQGEVFTSTPAQPEMYSALTAHVHVTWNNDATPRILDSQDAIMKAKDSGEVTLSPLPVVLNMPHIVWPGGQMMVKEDKTLADDTPYGGGQVLDIDTEKMKVTFVAHRGWGPDGRTIYYIVTDATPSGPAGIMGVVDAPTSASLIANSAAVDLFQFGNGITGSGPLGFQPGIAAGALGDVNYSPMWRIFVIEWEDPDSASLLQTKGDIDAYQQEGLISVGLARPMDSDHIVNCPFIDPFQ